MRTSRWDAPQRRVPQAWPGRCPSSSMAPPMSAPRPAMRRPAEVDCASRITDEAVEVSQPLLTVIDTRSTAGNRHCNGEEAGPADSYSREASLTTRRDLIRKISGVAS